jgi:hypothetical protein
MKDPLPVLHVEGKDDGPVIRALLARHGIRLDKESGPVLTKTAKGLNEQGTESVEALLDGMKLAIAQSDERPIGFVFDADDDISSRWAAIRHRLESDPQLERSRRGGG